MVGFTLARPQQKPIDELTPEELEEVSINHMFIWLWITVPSIKELKKVELKVEMTQNRRTLLLNEWAK